MPHSHFIFLIGFLVIFPGNAVAVAQGDVNAQAKIGAHQQRLAKGISLLLGDEVQSEALVDLSMDLARNQADQSPSYQTMNQRALRLRTCHAYIFHADALSPDDWLWRERLANYGVRLVEISGKTPDARLLSLANELSELYPEKRETIAARLDRELQRRRLANEYLDLAQHQSKQ